MLNKAKSQKEESEELEDDRQENDDVDPETPTWIRIANKYVLPETLNHYRLRWDYDEVSQYVESYSPD